MSFLAVMDILSIMILDFANLVAMIACLWILAKILKFKKQDFKTPIIISATSMIIYKVLYILFFDLRFLVYYLEGMILLMMIYILYFLVYLFLIKKFYGEGWKKTLIMGVVAFIVPIIISLITTRIIYYLI